MGEHGTRRPDTTPRGPKGADEGASTWIAFDDFVFWPAKNTLQNGNEQIPLGSRALGVLKALLERPGETVSKQELSEAGWGRSFVEDATLRMTIVNLRKALDDPDGHAIENVQGEGYRLSPRLELKTWPPSAALEARQPSGQTFALSGVVGREAEIAAIEALMREARLVTIAGVGGVGKTTVALAIAEGRRREAPAHIADLALLTNADLIPWQIALALGAGKTVRDAGAWLLQYADPEPFLLVLDNCERAAAIVANIAERLLLNCPRARLLATSREPLRAHGEAVFRLGGLAAPAARAAPGEPDAASFPAVRLLLDRVFAARRGPAPSEAMIEEAAEICRRLDGLPLAIELAASRVASLGFAAVAESLGDRFGLLTSGSRTAPARHRTLEATFNWSYQLLDPVERSAFRQLSVFPGRFSLDMASYVVEAPGARRVAILADLVDKSMVVADDVETHRRFRLLESLRSFASERLRETGEETCVARRHAELVLADWRKLTARGGPALELPGAVTPEQMQDCLAALRFAMLSPEDAELARDLLAAAMPAARVFGLSPDVVGPLRVGLGMEMTPQGRLVMLVMLAGVISLSDWLDDFQVKLFVEAARLAEELGRTDEALQALWGLSITENTYHRPHNSLQAGIRMSALARARDRETDAVMGDVLQSNALHVLGRHVEAEALARRASLNFPGSARAEATARYHFDPLTASLTVLASIEHARGRVETATATAERAVAEAVALEHAPSQFLALSHAACPIALMREDWDRADRYLAQLRPICEIASGWKLWLDGFEAARLALSDRTPKAIDRLDDFVQQNFLERSNAYCAWFKLQLIRRLIEQGKTDRARALVVRLLDELQESQEDWLAPEALTLSGMLAGDAASAARAFERALSLSQAQGASGQALATALAWRGSIADDADGEQRLAAALEALPEGRDDRLARLARGILTGA
jgi:predicted ATPase/DNA-binding winged helix-turn-helix (wHTH) protein